MNDGQHTPINALCLAGGVALNCAANKRILDHTPWESLWIQPAAHDAGTALGAALLTWHSEHGGPSRLPLENAYLGPEFPDSDCESALVRAGLSYSRPNNLAKAVAKRLAEGKVAGWFHGRMEFGPRALGNRSILADPSRAEIRSRVNRKIKEREPFRPFAPTVSHEDAHKYFELSGGLITSQPTEYMLMTIPVKQNKIHRLAGAVHLNEHSGEATARVQILPHGRNSLYGLLLEECSAELGTRAVLNTSFNVGEPMVCRPLEACQTFLRSDLDVLALGSFLVERT